MENIISVYDKRRLPAPVAYLFLFLLYISAFRIFATLPLEGLNQAISTSSIILLSLFYILSLILNIGKNRINRMDILMWIFISANFLAAYKGHVVFGQPYYFGIMAQRSVLLCLSGILLISFLKKGLISMMQVERSFFFISLCMLVLYYYFFLFVNPAHFTESEFVTYSPIRGYRYKFQFALVIMLLFYSLFKISHERKRGYILIILLILFYLIYFLQSRTTLIILAITLLIYFYRNFSIRQRVRKVFLYGTLILVSVIVMVSLGYTSIFNKYELLFQNVLNVFINDSPGDASSAIRFIEFNTAIDYIWKNPLLGNGFISNQWNGGWQGIMGYFYPADIGIFGNIFVFGLIGTILIYLPYYFSLKMSRKIQSVNVFYKACEYMLLFLFLSMFVSALNIRDSSSIMFLVCLIYYFRYHFEYDNNVEEDQSLISAMA